MSLLKLGSPALSTCPACGQQLFVAAHVITLQGRRFHSECIRPRRSNGRTRHQPHPRSAQAQA